LSSWASPREPRLHHDDEVGGRCDLTTLSSALTESLPLLARRAAVGSLGEQEHGIVRGPLEVIGHVSVPARDGSSDILGYGRHAERDSVGVQLLMGEGPSVGRASMSVAFA
jgi:hypothetical protein